MYQLSQEQEVCLHRLLSELINQAEARVLVPPYQPSPGYWFGGGNLVQDQTGVIWLSGRYRNYGDARLGLQAGERGLECAVFRSADGGQSFSKALSWSKTDLSRPGRQVLSIEGTALHRRADGTWELFISSEKDMDYPPALADYQKPGTGVWTIDRLAGPTVEGLEAISLTTVLENQDQPEYLHVKDPVVFEDEAGQTVLIFCSHPYNWSSSNTGLALRPAGESQFRVESWEMVPRGPSWDVAATRVTNRLPLPKLGCFANAPACSIYFYDGAESLRALDENPQARRRPRGYSCEELGGALFGWDEFFPQVERLTRLAPLFISPWGTGCSRYVDTLVTEQGILASWQQSQQDQSQPLVGHFLAMDQVEQILTL